MKKYHSPPILLCVLLAPLCAIEPPSKTMPIPPSEVQNEEHSGVPEVMQPEVAAPIPKERRQMHQAAGDAASYVGIRLSAIPDELALHLGLEKSKGALVRLVAPDSPAHAAGIEAFDIINSIDGKAIQGHDCLCGILKHRKPGEQLDVVLLRRGEQMNRKITLGIRPEGLSMEANPDKCDDPASELMRNVPERFAPEIRKLLEQNFRALGDLDSQFPNDANLDQMHELQKRAQKTMDEMLQGQSGVDGWNKLDRKFQMLSPNGSKMQLGMKSRISVMDSNGRIEINRNGDASDARVYDAQGNLEWSGPFTSDEEKKAIPPTILKRLDKLNIQTNGLGGGSGNGIELKLHSNE